MSYTYQIEPAKMFEDRLSQILSFGIPKEDVAALRSSIQDMWADAPGGWVYEWSKRRDFDKDLPIALVSLSNLFQKVRPELIGRFPS
jgi:hypothetical protein